MVQMEVSENSGAVRELGIYRGYNGVIIMVIILVIEKVRIIIVILYRKWKLLYRI